MSVLMLVKEDIVKVLKEAKLSIYLSSLGLILSSIVKHGVVLQIVERIFCRRIDIVNFVADWLRIEKIEQIGNF